MAWLSRMALMMSSRKFLPEGISSRRTRSLSLRLLLTMALREGIEHPTSGTSFLEAVAILYVITIAAATADADFKQFLDGMEVVDEGSAGEFRSLAEL